MPRYSQLPLDLHYEVYHEGEMRGAVHLALHVCLRCGAVVLGSETARHDIDHIAKEGPIPEEEWDRLDRPLPWQ
jgi:hypothetical protein